MKGEDRVKLKVLRQQVKKTQTEVAAYVGVSQSTYFFWESGKLSPNAKYLPALAAALHCTIDDLFEKGDTDGTEA